MIQYDVKDEDILNDLAPDLTPMLDILFILLVFFLLTAGAVLQSMELTLPSSVSEELEMVDTPNHILLEIRNESYAVNGNSMDTFSKFKDAAASQVKEQANDSVIVAGDKDISMERLLEVLTYLQSEGIQVANILMQKEN
ncbi:biopolymer transporter ExbD [Curvivirga sp.]|uniref:biopolymer transporter ExbD n=1 Tax=Curvivirga sp. TaxID=2856848 RepID=UPI003B5C9A85